MRFMLFMIPAPKQTPEEYMPTPEMVAAMMQYNRELAEKGVLLSLDGLQPVEKGARVSFSGGQATVKDGPFSEAKEVIGGYWLLQCRSKEEAVELARRCPAADGDIIEVRQVFEMSDFPPEVQAAAGPLPL